MQHVKHQGADAMRMHSTKKAKLALENRNHDPIPICLYSSLNPLYLLTSCRKTNLDTHAPKGGIASLTISQPVWPINMGT